MSYLSELKRGVLSPAQFLKNSAAWLARKAGLTDAKVDEIVAQADEATDEAEAALSAALSAYIGKAFPAVPKPLRDVTAEHAVGLAFKGIDMALAGFGEELKKITPDA